LIVFQIKKQLQKEWQIVFIVAACVYLVGTLVFAVFGNSTLQAWAVHQQKQVQGQSDAEKKSTGF